MTGLLLAIAVVVAVIAVASRRLRRARLERAIASRPGSSADRAIPVRSYDEIDDHLRARWCGRCGGYPERAGEGSRADAERRYRVARLRCQECDEIEDVFFDTTDVVH